jgi:hypothetical protein
VVSVDGPLSRAAIGRLRNELIGWREAGVLDLRVELAGISGVDTGLLWTLARMLAWARVQLRELGGDLIINGMPVGLLDERDAIEAQLGILLNAQHDRTHLRYRPETADQP